jgi:hypothetical protein
MNIVTCKLSELVLPHRSDPYVRPNIDIDIDLPIINMFKQQAGVDYTKPAVTNTVMLKHQAS